MKLITPVLVVTLTVAVVARQPPSSDSQPVFRTGAELVRLDVRVAGADGRPVEDLRADEIEILEEGQPRPILLFQHVREPAGSHVEVARRTIAGEVSTNQGAPRGHLYVLVFDQDHIAPGNAQKARAAAAAFLKTRLGPGDRVAVYGIPGPGPALGFTADGARAAAELVKVSGTAEQFGRGSIGTMRLQEAYEVTRGNDDVLTRVFMRMSQQGAATDVLDVIPGGDLTGLGGAASGDPSVMRQLVRQDAQTIVAQADAAARRFLVTLADVVRGLRDIEGRKAILLFSEGFYTDNVTRELELVAGAAAQSYSVVYAFDLNRRGLDLKEEGSRGGDQYTEIADRLNPLGSLAAETAGELIIDAPSHMERAIDRMADLSHDYYVLGFEPHADAVKDPTTYRRISVRIKRPGVRASTRTGYAVNRDEATPADRRRAIDAALGAPFPQQGLPVEYTTYVMRGTTPGTQRAVLSVETRLPVATPASAAADVVFVARRVQDGRIVASGTDTMLLPAAATHGSMGTSVYRVQFDVPNGDYLLRVVVREPGGLVGSADRRFRVQPLDGPGITASDLILGSTHTSRLPVRAAAHSSESITGMTEVYTRAPSQAPQVSGTMELVPAGAASAVRTTPMHVEPWGADGRARAVFELPLAGVPPGPYLARVVVRSPGETIAELVREVTVLDGVAPAPTTPATGAPGAAPAATAVNAPPAGASDAPSEAPVARPSVKELLAGEIVRDYLRQIRPAVPAAGHALAGAWDGVEPALGAPAADAPASVDALRGLALFARGDYASAADVLHTASRKDPGNATLAFLLGWAHVGAGDDRKAITSWRGAVLSDPALVPAYLALADTYVRLSQPELAGQVLRQGVKTLPHSTELWARLERLMRR